MFMSKVYLTHFMCAEDSIYTFYNCSNALQVQRLHVFFFWGGHEHRNIEITGMVIWTLFIKKR